MRGEGGTRSLKKVSFNHFTSPSDLACYHFCNIFEIHKFYISFFSQSWIKKHRTASTGCDCVFFCLFGAYVTFVFVFVVHFDNIPSPPADQPENSPPSKHHMVHRPRMLPALDRLSTLARTLQRPPTVRKQRHLLRSQIPISNPKTSRIH